MSVEALTIALHHSRATGAARLVLIGIANHDGDGGAWPSVATLARYGACGVRNVQKALTKLEELGEIRRHMNAGGNSQTVDHMRPNLYEVTLRCPYTCDGTKHHRDRTKVTFDQAATDPVPHRAPGAPQGTPPPAPQGTRTIPRTTHRDSGTKSGQWESARCPGDWRNATHELGSYGKCIHCHEKPLA